MAQVIKLKRGTTTPSTSNLVDGEVAVDTSAQKFYINDSGTIKEIGGGQAGSGIENVVEDTTPQLGGSLDLNNNNITGTGDIDIVGDVTVSEHTISSSITTTTSTATVPIAQFDATAYNSAKFVVSAENALGRQISEILFVHDNTNAYTVEYGTVSTTANEFATFSGAVAAGTATLFTTPSLSNRTTFRVSADYLKTGIEPNDAFELTVETTAANESFLLPMQSVTSIDVDWGDGTVDTGITTDNPTHTYATAGTHSISVTGTAGTVVFDGSGSESKLRTVTNLGSLGYTSLQNAFRACSSMTSFDAGDCDTSNVTTMSSMFNNCSSLTLLDVSNFDTSSVTNMSYMFFRCSSLASLDVSNFNTSNVTSMIIMFEGCSSLTSLDVSNFNTSNVTNMGAMFRLCDSLTDIIGLENFDISQVSNFNLFGFLHFMSGFALPTSRYDALLVNWEAQAVQPNLSVTFGNSQYTATVARESLIQNDGWTITDGGPSPFELTVETTAANETFTIPCQNSGTFDAVIDWGDGSPTSTVTAYNDPNLTHTYQTAGNHQISISGDFPNIYFNNNSGSDKDKVVSVDNLGTGWQRLDRSFYGCSNLTSFNFSPYSTEQVTRMDFMFCRCTSFTSLDVSNLNTSNVTNMLAMFNRCTSLTTLDVSSFDTSKVTDMSYMFELSTSLVSIDMSNLNTSNVTSMFRMFRDCSSLTDVIGIEYFNIESVTGNFESFMTGVTLPTSRYDALLVNWEAQTVNSGLAVNFGNSTYTAGGAAETARTSLITNDNWTITDGGAAP